MQTLGWAVQRLDDLKRLRAAMVSLGEYARESDASFLMELQRLIDEEATHLLDMVKACRTAP